MKAYDRISVDQWFLAAVGAVMLALAVAGMVHSTRASLAARLAYKARYGQPAASVEQVLDACRKAAALYPWNYYFTIFTAEMAYYRADDVTGEARAERLRQARFWCDRGLFQNGYKSQLRRLKTRFLWEDSSLKAIDYWKAHTDWQFWEPGNHAVLAELYARAGEFDQAEQSLKWVAIDPAAHQEARRIVEREKKIWDDSLEPR
ncbi:MAG: hypothetical protein WCL49_06075 [bacterium]